MALLATSPFAAVAVGLGEAQLRSGLGEALDVRIPILHESGEDVARECFAAISSALEGVPAVGRVELSVERTSLRPELRATTIASIREPAVSLTIRVACPGAGGGSLERTFLLLPDPPLRRTAPPPARAGLAFTAGASDTLAEMSRRFAAPGAQARRAWVDEVRVLNPDVANVGDDAPLPPGASLSLPTPPVRPAVEAPAIASAPPAPRRLERPPLADNRQPAKADRPRPARRPAQRPAPREPRFVLKLSDAAIDLPREDRLDEAARAELRERRLMLDSDDQVAALLSMRRSLRQLEGQMAEMQLRLSTLATAPAAQRPSGAAPGEPRPAEGNASVLKRQVVPPPAPAGPDRAFSWLWLVAGLLALLAAAMAFSLARRNRERAGQQHVDDASTWRPHAAGERAARSPAPEPRVPETRTVSRPAPAPAEEASAEPVWELSDSAVPTLEPFEAAATPESEAHSRPIAALVDVDGVMTGARQHYEEGAVAEAIGLLEGAIEDDPAELRPWLALAEIYRAERLAPEYAALARRFRERHQHLPEWQELCAFGLEIDPGNALYAEGAEYADDIDPLVENWLEAPIHFDDVALAAQLRDAVLEASGHADDDLGPDPLPVLRNAAAARTA